ALKLGRRSRIDLFAILFEQLLGRVGKAVEFVSSLDLLAPLLVGAGILLGFAHHAIDLLFRKTRTGGNGDLLLAARSEVLSGYVQEAVGVDIKGASARGHAGGRGRNPKKMELAERAVAARHRTLALQHVNFDRSLIVRSRREDLALARRNRGVALNELGEDSAQSFDSE